MKENLQKDIQKEIEKRADQGKKSISEFKKFALKGNIIDMSIGVIIGTGFSKIVASLTNDLIMPLVSLVTKKIDFTNMFISLDNKFYQTLDDAKKAGASTINYGVFITTIIDFLITAICIFIVMKQIQRVKEKMAKEEKVEDTATTKKCPFCQTDIHKDATRCPNCTSQL